MAFLDKVKSRFNVGKASKEEQEDIYSPSRGAFGSPRQGVNYINKKGNKILEEEQSRKDYEYERELEKARNKKAFEVEKDIEKARRIGRERLELERIRLADKRKADYEKQYGPAEFEIGGYKLKALAKINQYRNYQQQQDIKNLKLENARRYEQGRLQQYREAPRPTPSGGFGEPLSMGGGGFGMGGGMSLGPSPGSYGAPQDNYGYSQPQPQRDPMSMSMPIIGGLGGGFGNRQEEQPQEQQFVPQPRVQYAPSYPSYAAPPANALRNVPRAAPIAYVDRRNPNVVQYAREEEPGAIYRKVPTVYGSKPLKIRDASEIVPGEKLYRRVISRSGNREFILIKNRWKMKKEKFNLMNTTKDLVGSGILLGLGSSALGAMGQGQIANQVITPASKMLGPLATASYGMGIVNTFSDKKSKKGGY